MVTQRRLEAHRDTPPVLVKPVAIHCVVTNVFSERTLFVRLPDHTTGLERSAWEKGYAALSQGDTYNSQAPTFWGSTDSRYQVVRGKVAEGRQLKFFFAPGNQAYSELLSRPGVRAIVTADREQGYFLACKFLPAL